MNIEKWLRQPTTIMAIASAGAIATGFLTHLVTGNPTIDALAGSVVFVLTQLGIDDHSAVASAAGKVEGDIAGMVAHGATQASVVMTLEDVAALARAMQPPAATAAISTAQPATAPEGKV